MIGISAKHETTAPRARTVALDDRTRLPWRFLSRHIAIDALSGLA